MVLRKPVRPDNTYEGPEGAGDRERPSVKLGKSSLSFSGDCKMLEMPEPWYIFQGEVKTGSRKRPRGSVCAAHEALGFDFCPDEFRSCFGTVFFFPTMQSFLPSGMVMYIM